MKVVNSFSAAVKRALKHGLSITDFTDEFGVCKGTVYRWASGKSIPHLMARPRILNWIKHKETK